MTFRPNPKQALLLWKMLTAESADDRSPMQSKAKPAISGAERADLVKNEFIELAKQQSGGARIELTDKAWAWAAIETNVQLLRSRSTVGVEALEGLLHQLIPFLQARGIALAEVFPEPSAGSPSQQHSPKKRPIGRPAPSRKSPSKAGQTKRAPAKNRVELVCRELNAQKPNGAIRLAHLRARLSDVPRQAFDSELQRLHAAGRIALYRDDNSAAVTADDDQAALSVGGEPRHLLYWKE
jgi:hypothetical protein